MYSNRKVGGEVAFSWMAKWGCVWRWDIRDYTIIFHLKNYLPCLVWCHYLQHNLTCVTVRLCKSLSSQNSPSLSMSGITTSVPHTTSCSSATKLAACGHFCDKTLFLPFLPAPDTKQTWRQFLQKGVADIMYPKSGFGPAGASGPSSQEVGCVGYRHICDVAHPWTTQQPCWNSQISLITHRFLAFLKRDDNTKDGRGFIMHCKHQNMRSQMTLLSTLCCFWTSASGSADISSLELCSQNCGFESAASRSADISSSFLVPPQHLVPYTQRVMRAPTWISVFMCCSVSTADTPYLLIFHYLLYYSWILALGPFVMYPPLCPNLFHSRWWKEGKTSKLLTNVKNTHCW